MVTVLHIVVSVILSNIAQLHFLIYCNMVNTDRNEMTLHNLKMYSHFDCI